MHSNVGSTATAAGERIATLDILRGAALLGILLMNILVFGLPMAAEGNPTVAGGDTGPNLIAWILQYLLFEGKMRGIFSLMFGASVLLLINRAERSGASSADIHYRRTLWLILFGMIHGYLIWIGDILFSYGIMALLLYPLRKLSPRALLVAAGCQFFLMTAGQFGEAYQTHQLRDRAAAADRAQAAGAKLTKEQTDAQKEWQDKLKDLQPNREQLDKEIQAHRGSWWTVRTYQAKELYRWHALPVYSPFLWDMLAMMLIGMALIQNGVLSGERPAAFYWKLMLAAYPAGLAIGGFAVWRMLAVHFAPVDLVYVFTTYEPARLAMTLGHVALLVLIARSARMRWITAPLAAVGKTAFSNYIATSLICTTIFYGYGFGLFAKLERHQLYYVVAGVWLFNLVASTLWLRHYRFGPLEWCWRSLTWWEKQPMRLTVAGANLEPHEDSPQKESIAAP